MANWVSPGVDRTLAATSATTLTNGGTGTAVLKSYKDGQWLCGEIIISFSGASAAGLLTFTVTHRGVALTIDTSSLAGGTASDAQGKSVVGSGHWRDNGTQYEPINVCYASTTTLSFSENTQDITGDQMANGDSLKCTFRVPIVGWT